MEYTKGEWTIQTLPHNFAFRKGKTFVIRDRRNCALAEVGHIDAIFDGEETEANAYLIAAAPAMYEALKAWDKYATASTPKAMPLKLIAVELATQALAQAEGKL